MSRASARRLAAIATLAALLGVAAPPADATPITPSGTPTSSASDGAAAPSGSETPSDDSTVGAGTASGTATASGEPTSSATESAPPEEPAVPDQSDLVTSAAAPAPPAAPPVAADWPRGSTSFDAGGMKGTATWVDLGRSQLAAKWAKAEIAQIRESMSKGDSMAGTGEIVWGGGNLVAERLTTRVKSDDASALSTSLAYFDVVAKKTTPSAALLTDRGREIVTTYVYQQLLAIGLYAAPAGKVGPPSPLGAYFDDILIGQDGSLAVSMAPGLLTAPDVGVIAITIPGKQAASLLSKAGARVAAVVASQRPFVGTKDPGNTVVDCSKLKCVALTFDDGPSENTLAVLAALEAAGVHATFFELGSQVEKFPEISKKAVAGGNEIGNHSWSHPDLTTLDRAGIQAQLSRSADEIHAATGEWPSLVRPPYGAYNQDVRDLAGVPLVLWSVDTLDWRDRDPVIVAERATTDIKPGSIILMHDIRETTAEALPGIIASLQAQGFTLVTVSQLYADTGMKLGVGYGGRS